MSVSLSLPRQALAPGDSYSVDVSIKTISATGASDAVVATATAQMAYDAANSRFYTTSPVSIPNIPVGTNYLLETIINVTTATSTHPVSYAGAIIDISDGAWNNVTVSPATSLAAMAMMRHGVQNSLALASIPSNMEAAISNAISEFTASAPTYAKSFYSSFLATHNVNYNIDPFAPANWGSFTGMTTTLDSVVARANSLLASDKQIEAGAGMTCALTTSGGVKCWGRNDFGSLGDGTTTNRSTPVDVAGLTSGVSAITSQCAHTCALTTGGGVKCWGYNSSGELGDGTTTDRLTPVDVSGLTSGVSAITSGCNNTCALTTGGGVKCWGNNFSGELGDGTTTQRLTPVDVSGLTSGAASISAEYANTCALTTGGGVKCWGDNQYGQLGDGTTTQRLTAVDVTGLTSGVAVLSAGTLHTCAITTSGVMKCWGDNQYGQLGDGTTTQRLTPVDVIFSSASAAATTWAKIFGGTESDEPYSIQQTSDGGYIVTGYTISYGAGSDDIWVLKLDSAGSQIWAKTFGGAGSENASSVQQTTDGGYIVAGYTTSYGAGGGDIWMLKLNSSGNQVWAQTFGGTQTDAASSVQQTTDGGYIVAGYTTSYGAGGGDIWVLKLDSSGNQMWAQTFGGTGTDAASSVQQTPDGGYIVAGDTYSYGAGVSDIWVLKLDSFGNQTWAQLFGGTESDQAHSVKLTPDGGYIVAGVTSSYGAGGADVWVLKLDSTGSQVWAKTFGGTGNDGATCAGLTADAGYVTSGFTNSYGAGSDDFWVLKLDSAGSQVWARTFGGADIDWPRGNSCIQQTADGGYITAGFTHSYGAGSSDIWVLKLDSSGNCTGTGCP